VVHQLPVNVYLLHDSATPARTSRYAWFPVAEPRLSVFESSVAVSPSWTPVASPWRRATRASPVRRVSQPGL